MIVHSMVSPLPSSSVSRPARFGRGNSRSRVRVEPLPLFGPRSPAGDHPLEQFGGKNFSSAVSV